MVTTHDALAVWEKVMAAKQGSTPLRRGTIGDGAGNVEVEGLPGWVWIRYDDEQNRLSQVRCPLGYLDHDTRVLSGKWHPDDDYEQVLSINWGPYSWDMRESTFAGYKLPQHGDTHHGTYGTDPAYIDYNNITIGRVLATDPASLTVAIESFVYPYGMETLDYDGGTIDLTAHVPVGAGHRYVLIYFDLDTQASAVIAGDIAPEPAPPSIPALTTNGIPLAVVELYNGQTEIVYDNIWQRKLMLGSVGGTVTPHTHTTDASGGSSLIGIQELMLNCATSLPVIGGQIWPVDVYHELYVQDTSLYMSNGTLEADLVKINADLAWGCGQLLFIRPTEPGVYVDYRITVRHGVGNIQLYGERDVVLDDKDDHMLLIYNGEHWCDMAHHLSKFGEFQAGNYSEFEEDGTLVAYGEATIWDDQQVNLGAVGFGASAPSWTDYKDSTVLAFDKNQDNTIKFVIQYSHKLKLGAAIEFHVHNTVPDNNAGNVKWVLTVSFADIGDTFPVSTSYTVLQIIAANSQDEHLYFDISDDIGNTSGVSGIALCSLMREGTDGVDTYDNDIYLVALDAHIELDTIGSRQELSK